MIAVIKYNAGNIRSVENALIRLGYQSIITDDANIISQADKVILPGVGEASSAMKYLKERELDMVIRSLKQPVLGICLGQQLMCSYSEEGDTDCLGIFNAKVKKFPPKDLVPHMGWNNLSKLKGELFRGEFEHGGVVEADGDDDEGGQDQIERDQSTQQIKQPPAPVFASHLRRVSQKALEPS